MKKANDEKIRLEEKQRELRKWRQEKGIEHKSVYFDLIPEDSPEHTGEKGELMWSFNG